ncbi:flagellar basal body rod protein FlgG [Virgibacillus necropolis]|uniref:flagellar basal body rod protein FlgG n=1 Tax=Virgibacillus necropolis TaxID=163877 RepID=UPI003850CB80
MLRSMYAGISGMKGFQTKLDVIGNNIANVNTVGFKKGRVTFQDMMSQTMSGAQGPTATRGGVNASQVGLGSQVGSIDNVHTQGFRQTTGRPLDLALEGDGMFVVASDLKNNDGEATMKNINLNQSNVSYTRAGNFYLDEEGSIVNPQGLYLIGFPAETNADGETTINDAKKSVISIPDTAQSFNIQTNGTVTVIDKDGNTKTVGQVALASFSNPGGLQKAGSNLFLNTENAGLYDNEDTDYIDLKTPDTDGTATIVSGSLEMSNVDLATAFTEMIVAQRGFQANTRIITTSDEILQELVNLKR